MSVQSVASVISEFSVHDVDDLMTDDDDEDDEDEDEDDEDEDEDEEGGIVFDIELLEENIEIILDYMEWSCDCLINVRALYPKWVYRIGKPWISLNHDEAFIFFFALSLTLHFAAMTFGYAFKFASNETLYKFSTGQLVLEVIMFFLTFFLTFYPPYKCYIYVYFWVCVKCFHLSSVTYSILVYTDHWWRSIEGSINLLLHIYTTLGMMMHSLVDYARLGYVTTALEEILKEEEMIVEYLQEEERLANEFFEDL